VFAGGIDYAPDKYPAASVQRAEAEKNSGTVGGGGGGSRNANDDDDIQMVEVCV
jgi:hypothetical protein